MKLLDLIRAWFNVNFKDDLNIQIYTSPIGVRYYKWNRGADFKLTSHFNTSEFECHCNECKTQMINIELVERCESLREEVNAPLVITSGYRCRRHQDALRNSGLQTSFGVSTHESGDAVDLEPAMHLSYQKRTAICKKFKVILPRLFKAVGDGGHWFHVDMREDKKRLWTYN